MPMHEMAVELLKETGPLAVSSANLTGRAPARSADEAEKMLGDAVAVYLDGGPSGHAEPSTIIDLTGSVPRLLRAGAVSEEKLRSVVGVLLTSEDEADTGEADEAEESQEKTSLIKGEKGPSLTKED
jgi:tRNA A37 threonylcarbamoyladenosine synthetase subunit TsaC/SUA5/YrdC